MKTEQDIKQAINAVRAELQKNGSAILSSTDEDERNKLFGPRRTLRQRLWVLNWVLGLYDEDGETPENIELHQTVEIV